jgi:hypothetical protein
MYAPAMNASMSSLCASRDIAATPSAAATSGVASDTITIASRRLNSATSSATR